MEIDKDYMRFCRWFKDIEISIHQGQWGDKQIAYAAWKEGHKLQPVPAIYYVTANRTYCGCVEPRQVYSMGTVVYCTVCGKPIIGSVSG